jgi:sugar phosphate permease
MATPLSPAHRSWRTNVFIATWLSYVGFYFCRKPFSVAKAAIGDEAHWDATTLGNIWAAYLISYALGQFLAAGMGTKLGPRRNVLLGMGVSVVVTVAMGVTLSVPVMTGLVAVNGLAQATGWSGNVGTMAAWFHKHERGRVMGAWSTNFTVGSLLSTWVMAWVLDHHLAGEGAPWRWCFYVGAGVLTLVWLQFYVLQRNKPEDVGLAPVDDPVTPGDESLAPEVKPAGWFGLSRSAWTNLMLVAGFYFCAKFIRYAIWSWAAFFLKKNYGLSDGQAGAYSTAFDLLGIPGVFLTGWISDRYFHSRRGETALIFMLAMVAATAGLIMFGGAGVGVFTVLLGAVGFTLFGPDALLSGAGAMDIGSRQSATFAAAVISGFGSMGAVLQELVISRMYDSDHGELGPVFQLLFGSAALAAVFCAILVVRNRRGGKGI